MRSLLLAKLTMDPPLFGLTAAERVHGFPSSCRRMNPKHNDIVASLRRENVQGILYPAGMDISYFPILHLSESTLPCTR